MVRATLLIAGTALLASASASAQVGREAAPPSAAPPTPTFVISGHGWGHGVGMSQYGAYGYAQHGVGYSRILAHYYPGTVLASAPLKRVRVLLAEGRTRVTIGSASSYRVTDADGKSYAVAAGDVTFDSGFKIRTSTAEKPQPQAKPLPGPLVFSPGTAPLQLGRPYRGQLQVSAAGKKLQVVNIVGLEAYVAGVVPSEMPHSWLPEALKAQAVAARSYALSHLHGGAFDLYPDVRSQVYGGVEAEQPETTAASNATAGQVLMYGSRVASTFFFSTSGGRTVAAADAWGTAVPYLVSVPDPYDSISPYHDWGPFPFTAKRLAKALHAPGRLLDVQTTPNSSGRVGTVTAIGENGESELAGDKVRTALELRSTWFSIGVVALAPPAGSAPLAYGGALRLTGVARGVPSVVLEQRPATASLWSVGPTVPARRDGAFSLVVRPKLTTSYRLSTGAARTAAVTVGVAPVVRFYPPRAGASQLRGLVRPVLPSALVELQRLAGTTWSTIARTRVDASGNFSAPFQPRSGSYRARVTAGHGLAPGTTKALEVVTG